MLVKKIRYLIVPVFLQLICNFSVIAEDLKLPDSSILFKSFSVSTSTSENEMTCKELDYNSYHKAERAKSNLIRSNPNRTHPNFAGKFLILENEMLLDTDWLIADCATGKFFHETVSGKADFKLDSSLIILKQKTESEYRAWANDQWVKIDPKTLSPPPSNIPGVTIEKTIVKPENKNILTQYENIFQQYPAQVPAESTPCAVLDFSTSNFANRFKTNLLKENAAILGKANFAGQYLMLKNSTLLDQKFLIADCKSGKFFESVISGNLQFKKDSFLVINNPEDKSPQLMVWMGDQWMKIGDPIQNPFGKVENIISGNDAKMLLEALPKKDKFASKFKFEKLFCSPTSTDAFCPIVRKWGFAIHKDTNSGSYTGHQILSGFCSTPHRDTQCEIVSGPDQSK